MSLCAAKIWWKSWYSLYHTNRKAWRRLCDGVGSFCKLQCRDLHSVKGILNHSMLQHHAIPSGTRLMDQGFVIMKDNDPKPTSKPSQKYIKSKREQHVLQMTSWPVQSADLNFIELVWDELGRKVRTKQHTRAATLAGKLGWTIFSLAPVFAGKNAENPWSSVSSQRGSF